MPQKIRCPGCLERQVYVQDASGFVIKGTIPLPVFTECPACGARYECAAVFTLRSRMMEVWVPAETGGGLR